MQITIVGIQCPKTERTYLNAEAAAGERGMTTGIRLITDVAAMARIGVHHTPTVLINDKEKSSGRIPSMFEFRTWIDEETEGEVAAVAETATSH